MKYSNQAFSFDLFKPFSFFRDIAYNIVKDAGDTLSDLLYPTPENQADRKVRVYKTKLENENKRWVKLEQEKKNSARLELKNKREKSQTKQFTKSK